MKYRKLGRTGLEVSEIGYGAWGISGKQWIGATDDNSLAALRKAIDSGLNFIDTALAYGDGKSEELVGQAVRESAQTVYVATKVPPMNRVWPARPESSIEEVFPYRYIIDSTETSLRNLGVETIDLQQLHVWNPAWVEREEWRRAFETLRTAGKVKYFGVSINDHQPETGVGIIETGLIDTVQVIYNVFDQGPEKVLFPACMARNIGVLARVPFDEGSLTGRINAATVFPEGDFRNSYFRGDRKKQVEERVVAILRALGLSEPGDMAAVAMRFCLSHPAVSTVIPGMRSISSVESNVRSSDLGVLAPETLAILRRHAWDRNFYA
jgi:aryl-alcohol dehydrogenase-like predicted oxidoreductase